MKCMIGPRKNFLGTPHLPLSLHCIATGAYLCSKLPEIPVPHDLVNGESERAIIPMHADDAPTSGRDVIRAVRRLNEEKGYSVAVMMDTEGSEIHMGDFGTGVASRKAEVGAPSLDLVPVPANAWSSGADEFSLFVPGPGHVTARILLPLQQSRREGASRCWLCERREARLSWVGGADVVPCRMGQSGSSQCASTRQGRSCQSAPSRPTMMALWMVC